MSSVSIASGGLSSFLRQGRVNPFTSGSGEANTLVHGDAATTDRRGNVLQLGWGVTYTAKDLSGFRGSMSSASSGSSHTSHFNM